MSGDVELTEAEMDDFIDAWDDADRVGDLLPMVERIVAAREAAAEQRGRETALREAADEFHERAQAHTLATVPSRAYRDANMQAAQWLRERA